MYRIPQVNDDMNVDSEETLLKNFDFLCAIDPNTSLINGKPV